MSESTKVQETIIGLNKKNMDGFLAMQKELLDIIQETNHDWCERLSKEAMVTSDYINKIGASRTVPEAVAVYQEWMSHCIESLGQDTSKVHTGQFALC